MMRMTCPGCGAEAGWPPYTCGSCGTVVRACPVCGGDGLVTMSNSPARPVRPRRPDVEAVAPTDRAREHLATVVNRPALPMADDDVDSYAQVDLSDSVDVNNPQEG